VDLHPPLLLPLDVHRARLFRILVVFEERHHGVGGWCIKKARQGRRHSPLPGRRFARSRNEHVVHSVLARYARGRLSWVGDDSASFPEAFWSTPIRIWLWTSRTPASCSTQSSAIRFCMRSSTVPESVTSPFF